MNRRQWIGLSAAGTAALLAGAGLAWWRLAPRTEEQDVQQLLFTQSFPDTSNQLQPLSQWRGKLLVVNFWATWCAPCVEEMPELQAVRDEYLARGVEVLGLGIDTLTSIQVFRAQLKLTLPLLAAGPGGNELGRAMGNMAGALPYTALVSRQGRIVQRRLGRIFGDELRKWLDAHLQSG